MIRPKKKPQRTSEAMLEEVRGAVAVWHREPGLAGPRTSGALGDVVDVLPGTGARIAEVPAIRWQDVGPSGEVGKVAM